MIEFLSILFIFIALFLVMLTGIPVGASMGLVGIVFGLIFWGSRVIDIVYSAFWNYMNNWGLVAGPTFILMSVVLYRCGIADEMFEAFWRCLGHIRGSLAVISIILGVVIGAMSSVAVAGIAILTYLAYPLMLKYNYPRRLAIGSIVFGGSLPLIVPPSINMIVYSLQTGVSMGYLFAGGIGVAFVMALLGLVYVMLWSYTHKEQVPVIAIKYTLREKLVALKGLIAPTIIIIGTLGAIFTGVATPTEAGGVGAFLTMAYAILRKRLTAKLMLEIALETARTMGNIILILVGGTAFGATLAAIGGRKALLDFMGLFPPELSFWIAQLIIILLGMFLDNLTICAVFAPLLADPLMRLGFSPLWIGIVFMATVMTELLSPPVGMSMFIFKGFRPEVTMGEIYRASLPFFLIMCLTVVIIILFPQTVHIFVSIFSPR